MRAAGADAHFEQGELLVALQHAIFAPRCAALRQACRHARAMHGIARDWAIDAAGVVPDAALYQRQINLLDFASRELAREILMRGVGFGNEENAAGQAVEAVNDAGTQIAAELRKRIEA